MTWRVMATAIIVILWARLVAVNAQGLPRARELYIQHHPDLPPAAAASRITRGTIQALLLNSVVFAALLWLVWAW